MLVAIDASRVEPRNKTGVEYYSLHLLQKLMNVIPPNIQVILYSRVSIKEQFPLLPSNWQNKVLKWPFKFLWSQLRLAWQTHIDKPNVTFIPAHAIPFFIKGKVILTIHDISWKKSPVSYSFKSRWYLRLATWWGSLRANAVITVSEYSKFSILKYYKRLKNKIFTIHLASSIMDIIDVSKTTSDCFVYIGRIERKKNLLTIINAFKKNTDQKLSLVLVGKDGVGADEIRASARRDKRIILTGWLEQAQVAKYFNKAIAVLIPSAIEGFGMPVLEAWQMGVPVIAANSGSLPEICAQACILVDPQDEEGWAKALAELSANSQLRDSLIKNGQEELTKYSWEKTAQETWRVIRLIISLPGVNIVKDPIQNLDNYE